VNERVRSLRSQRGLSHAALGWRDQNKSMSRSTCALIAERLDDEILAGLAYSDILWDPIVSIEPAGAEMAYDLTVGELHNFVVDDLLTAQFRSYRARSGYRYVFVSRCVLQ